MRTNQLEFIGTIIAPIPFVGVALADMLYTWSSYADAMNLRQMADDDIIPLPPGDSATRLPPELPAVTVRKAA